jgi:pyruvate dehydrogenase E2 component (dihydrolipoamide acetyltransferase)
VKKRGSALPINILMPALSPTMDKGNLAKWHVKEGDQVAPGDVIAEIETDKATMEVEAVEEGTVARILVPEGTEDVPVNDVIAVLAAEGEDAGAIEAPAPPGNGGAAAAEPAPEKAEREPPAPPREREREAEPSRVRGNGERVEAAPSAAGLGAEPAAPAPARPAPRANGERSGRVFASPLARRLAREQNLDLAAIAGSGPHGRVVKRDIEVALEKGVAPPAPEMVAPAARPAGMTDEQILQLFEEGTYELVPHDSMRRTIARRIVEAKATIPHFYLTLDCDIGALQQLRKQINDAAPVTDGEPAYKLSVNDLVIKALAMALKTVPDANVTWTEGGMLRHRHADVGVAVAIPGGLITPVVRRAEEKTLSVISNEMRDLTKRAREKKLKPHEYQGGSTAVSNLGMYGIRDFAAVINPPHATILAVGAGEKRAVVRDGEIVAADLMTATLSTDHRAVDGALGAELLTAFKRYIENPAAMLV